MCESYCVLLGFFFQDHNLSYVLDPYLLAFLHNTWDLDLDLCSQSIFLSWVFSLVWFILWICIRVQRTMTSSSISLHWLTWWKLSKTTLISPNSQSKEVHINQKQFNTLFFNSSKVSKVLMIVSGRRNQRNLFI